MQKYKGKVFVEEHRAGSGYDIQDQALIRLGATIHHEFDALTTSGQIRRFAETYKHLLETVEYQEFIKYADYIGFLFGYQDESDTPSNDLES